MTGNLVFIGLGMAGASGFSVGPAFALSGFVVGALIGAQICRHSGVHRGRALRNITVFNALLAVPVTLIVIAAGDHLLSDVRTLVTVLLAASMGGQHAWIRYLKSPRPSHHRADANDHRCTHRTRTRSPRPSSAAPRLAVLAGVAAAGLLTRFVSVGAALTFGLCIIVAVGVATHFLSRTRAP